MNKFSTNQKKALAKSLINKNDFAGASRVLIDLYQNSPDGEICYLLGIVNVKARDFSSAENYMKQAINIQPDSDIGWQGLGMCQMHYGKYAEALSSFNQCLAINPKNTQAMNSLGNIYRETGKIDIAEKYFISSLKIQPNNPESLSFLGNIYLGKCMYDAAIKYYKKSVKRNPDYVDAHYNLGCAYQGLGQHGMAVKYYKRAMKLNPSATQPITAIANSLEKQGKNHAALELLNPLINKNMFGPDVVTTYAKVCINTRAYTDGIDVVNKFFQSTDRKTLSPILEQEIRFSLGDLYNKTGQYDNAYDQYRTANEMRPHNYNRTATESYFKSIISEFSQDKISGYPVSDNSSSIPVFIVGMPRSGTSLIEQILASHSEIAGAGELSYISDIANLLNHGGDRATEYPKSLQYSDLKFLNKQSENYLAQLRKYGVKSRHITDKMPHNFMYIGLIKMLFPNSKIIHCLRDPVDVCLSIYFHNFNSNHPYSDNLDNLGHYYNQYRNLMSHWSSIYESDILDVSYEDIVSDSDRTIRELLGHLDLEWQDECLRFYENKRTVSTPSYSQVRQPLYNTSIKRWKNYEKHIDKMLNSIDKGLLI